MSRGAHNGQEKTVVESDGYALSASDAPNTDRGAATSTVTPTDERGGRPGRPSFDLQKLLEEDLREEVAYADPIMRIGPARIAAFVLGCVVASVVVSTWVVRVPFVVRVRPFVLLDMDTSRAVLAAVHVTTSLGTFLVACATRRKVGLLKGLLTALVPYLVVASSRLLCAPLTTAILAATLACLAWQALNLFRELWDGGRDLLIDDAWLVAEWLEDAARPVIALVVCGQVAYILGFGSLARGSAAAVPGDGGTQALDRLLAGVGQEYFYTYQEAADELQAVVNAACAELGIEGIGIPTVCVAPLQQGSSWFPEITAAYMPLTNVIFVDSYYARHMWSDELANVALHEVAHVQQFRAVLGIVGADDVGIVEGLDDGRLGMWRWEFIFYDLLAHDYEGYSALEIEGVAEDYASDRMSRARAAASGPEGQVGPVSIAP